MSNQFCTVGLRIISTNVNSVDVHSCQHCLIRFLYSGDVTPAQSKEYVITSILRYRDVTAEVVVCCGQCRWMRRRYMFVIYCEYKQFATDSMMMMIMIL